MEYIVIFDEAVDLTTDQTHVGTTQENGHQRQEREVL